MSRLVMLPNARHVPEFRLLSPQLLVTGADPATEHMRAALSFGQKCPKQIISQQSGD